MSQPEPGRWPHLAAAEEPAGVSCSPTLPGKQGKKHLPPTLSMNWMEASYFGFYWCVCEALSFST